MQRGTILFFVPFLALAGCKKPTTVEVVSFEEVSSLYGGDKMSFNVKTAPKARVEGWSNTAYADAQGLASIEMPVDKVFPKPGGKGQIFLKVQPPRGSRLKDFAATVDFPWPAAIK